MNNEHNYLRSEVNNDYIDDSINSDESLKPNSFVAKGQDANRLLYFLGSLDSWVDTKLIIIFIILPVLALPFFYDKTDFVKLVFLAIESSVLLFIVAIKMMRIKAVNINMPTVLLPLGIMLLSHVVSLFVSLNSVATFMGFADNRSGSFLVFFLLLLALIFVFNSSERNLKRIFLGLKITLTIGLIFTALQILDVAGLGSALGDFVTPFGSLNSAGIVASILIALVADFCFALKDSSRSKFDKVIGLVGFAVAVFVVLLLNWWPLSILSITALILPNIISSLGNIKKIDVYAPAILIAILFLISSNTTVLDYIRGDMPIEIIPKISTMIEVASGSIVKFPQGVGFENFIYAYDLFRPADVINSQFNTLRFADGGSEILTKFIEGGLLAIFAIVVMIGFLVKSFIRRLKEGQISKIESSGWTILVLVFATAIFYPQNVSIVSLMMIGLVFVFYGSSSKNISVQMASYNRGFVVSILAVILCVVSIFGVYYSVNLARANYLINVAVKSRDVQFVIESLVNSAQLFSGDERPYRALGEALLLKIRRDIQAGPQKGESNDDFTARIKEEINSLSSVAQRIIEVQPNDAQNWFIRGYIYQNLAELVPGAAQLSVDSYVEALKYNPGSPATYYRIGNTFLESAERGIKSLSQKGLKEELIKSIKENISSDFAHAEENYKTAIMMYNNYGDAVYNLSATYERQGKLKEAIGSFELIVASTPNDPANWLQLGLLYYRNNQKEAALKAWTRAVEISPTYSNARWYLSLIFEERGKLDEALAQVLEIEKFNKDEPLVKQRIEQLNSGRRLIPPANLLDQKPL